LATTNYSPASTLPANIDAERSILGAILLDNFAYNEAAEHLKADDFSLDAHRRIYSRMMDLAESSRPIDLVTLAEELDRHRELQSIGDVSYLSALLDGIPDRPSIEHYVTIVRDKAMLRNLIHAANTAIARATEQADPASEILDSAEAALFQISEQRIGRGFTGIQEIIRDSFGSVDALLQRGQRITGLETHYERLDEMTSGFQPSDLVIIAGRPSMGKTTLAINIAENAALGNKVPAAIFSMEMSCEQLSFRMLSSIGRIPQTRLRTGKLHDEDWPRVDSAVSMMADAPIFIDDSGALTPTEVRARARRLKREHGLGLIVVDYLQLMQVSGTVENRATEISEISRSLKALAKELDVPVIALSQLNRSVEQRQDKRPVMSDLRESGAIEQDADVILFIYREEVYERETPRKGIADIIIAKQRNGPTGEFHLTFLGEYTRFENLVAEAYGEGVF